jgi:hypothetical protein
VACSAGGDGAEKQVTDSISERRDGFRDGIAHSVRQEGTVRLLRLLNERNGLA